MVSLEVVNHRTDLLSYYSRRGFARVGTSACDDDHNCGESKLTRPSFFVNFEKDVDEGVQWDIVEDDNPLETFTFVDRSVNRTIVNDSGIMLPQIVKGRTVKLDRELLASNLRQFHREVARQFKLRREMCRTGILDERGIGCGKCRWNYTGCERCGYQDKSFVHGKTEGFTGGIPFPSKEVDMQIVGELDDGGGVCLPCLSVSKSTPICQRIRALDEKARAWGVLTTRDIEQGEMVVEYVGEIMTKEQADLRERSYRERGLANSYAAHTGNHIIDATLFGNCSRFINHSCAPNLKFVRWHPRDKSKHILRNLPRIVFAAKRDIAAGEELTFDYGAIEMLKVPSSSSSSGRASKRRRRSNRQVPEGDNISEGLKCLCGQPACRGWLA